jgi:hypothetical protein
MSRERSWDFCDLIQEFSNSLRADLVFQGVVLPMKETSMRHGLCTSRETDLRVTAVCRTSQSCLCVTR